MLRIINWSNLSKEEQVNALRRIDTKGNITNAVQMIIQQVQKTGDQALYDLTSTLDSVQLASLCIPNETIQGARISQKSMDAINKAIETITLYHQSIIPESNTISTSKGIQIRVEYRPIQKVGLYVPGGRV